MRDDRRRLLDILEAIEAIDRYAARGRGVFDRDELVRVWVVHHLRIIGEAYAPCRRNFASVGRTWPGNRSSACETS